MGQTIIHSRIKRNANIASALAAAMLFGVFTSTGIEYSNSLFPLAVFFFLILIDRLVPDVKTRDKIFSLIEGMSLAIFTAFGLSLNRFGGVSESFSSILFLPSVLIWGYEYSKIIKVIWKITDNLGNRARGVDNSIFPHIRKIAAQPWLILITILVAWAPCFICTLPGGFVYDATREFTQMGSQWGYIGDFPMLHTFIITRLLNWTNDTFGSYNAGITIYVISQMMIAALLYTIIISRTLKKLKDYHIGIILWMVSALLPAIQILVTQTTRDILFGVILSISIYLLYEMKENESSFMGSLWKPCLLGLVLALAILSRNNNLGAATWIIIGTVLITILWQTKEVLLLHRSRKEVVGAIMLMASFIIAFLGVSVFLRKTCQPITQPSANASLSIATQQIVRAYKYKGDLWNADELEAFTSFFGEPDDIFYIPENADNTKYKLIVDESSKHDFFKLWREIGEKYPGIYVDALLANTKGAWFPSSVINGYVQSGAGPYQGFEKSYFYFTSIVDEPAEHLHLFSKVNQFYEKLCMMISFEKFPFISMLFSIGFWTWMTINGFFYSVHAKKRANYIPFIVLIAYVFISACAPLVILRYYSALFLSIPMIIAMQILPSKGNEAWDELNK